jgi:hypothetical protein
VGAAQQMVSYPFGRSVEASQSAADLEMEADAQGRRKLGVQRLTGRLVAKRHPVLPLLEYPPFQGGLEGGHQRRDGAPEGHSQLSDREGRSQD